MKLAAFKAAAVALVLAVSPASAQDRLLNVSYDVSRELFEKLNPVFAQAWKAQSGRDVTIEQSHAGSSKQARSILEGLPADVVTFNQETDVEMLAKGGMVAEDWRAAFPNNASPYYSMPAFLVREGNPKNINNWSDLARDDVQVVFPNPRTSGNGRYTYLAAYAFALRENGGDAEAAQAFVRKIMENVPVFDTGGRAATQTFVEREIGDVLVTFETETRQIAAQYADRGLVAEFEALAAKEGIPYQRTLLRAGGQAAAAAQQAATGARAIGIVVGTRYIHTVTEMIDRGDLKAARDLLVAYLRQ